MATDYSSAYSTTGFWGGLLSGLGSLFPSPGKALPTQPNPASQVLVATNAGRIVDAGSPTGNSMADLWYNPIAGPEVHGYEAITRPAMPGEKSVTGQIIVGQRPIYGPRMYYVKSQSQEAKADRFEKVSSAESALFRSPEAAAIQVTPCDQPAPEVVQTIRERENRLTVNQYLSPFRARRMGGNSYQALSEAQDNIFAPDGAPGDFSPEIIPAIVQSGRSLRLPRRG